jgi:hypothetical protein
MLKQLLGCTGISSEPLWPEYWRTHLCYTPQVRHLNAHVAVLIFQNFITGVIPQNLQLQAQVKLAAQADITSLESARSRVRVDQCVSAVRAGGGGASTRIRLLT